MVCIMLIVPPTVHAFMSSMRVDWMSNEKSDFVVTTVIKYLAASVVNYGISKTIVLEIP